MGLLKYGLHLVTTLICSSSEFFLSISNSHSGIQETPNSGLPRDARYFPPISTTTAKPYASPHTQVSRPPQGPVPAKSPPPLCPSSESEGKKKQDV